MTRCTLVCIALLALLAGSATAQPWKFSAGPYIPELTEAAQRKAANYSGFVYNFATGPKTDGGTPNGQLVSNQVGQNPFLTSLPQRGNGQTLVTMGPCSGNTPHTHPRGSEISFMTEGEILFGMVEENAGENKLIMETVSKGMTIHIPAGILHFSHNPSCAPAQFLANFGERDPGTQTVWNSLIKVPSPILQAATGIDESVFDSYKQLPLVIAPGTGGTACMAKCGLNFTTANAFEPSVVAQNRAAAMAAAAAAATPPPPAPMR